MFELYVVSTDLLRGKHSSVSRVHEKLAASGTSKVITEYIINGFMSDLYEKVLAFPW